MSSCANDATKLNDGHKRPVFALERHREVVGRTPGVRSQLLDYVLADLS